MGIPLNIDLQQVLLHVFNLLLLTGGLYFLLYSPVKKFMDAREEQYRRRQNEADEAVRAAQAHEAEAATRLAELDGELLRRRQDAEAELQSYRDGERARAEAEAERILAHARQSAEAERRELLRSADREIVDLTRDTVAKLLHADTESAYTAFLDAAEGDTDK